MKVSTTKLTAQLTAVLLVLVTVIAFSCNNGGGEPAATATDTTREKAETRPTKSPNAVDTTQAEAPAADTAK
ncbi:MAG: hypothetical protein SFU21_14335 [Flavihumibacter sp.]|nr:hypothetical protein [Flavihumibacter sp.]